MAVGKGDKERPASPEARQRRQETISKFATGMGDLKKGTEIKKKGYTIRKVNAGVADSFDPVQKIVLKHFEEVKDLIRFETLDVPDRDYECSKRVVITNNALFRFDPRNFNMALTKTRQEILELGINYYCTRRDIDKDCYYLDYKL